MAEASPAAVREVLVWAFRALVVWYGFYVAGTIQYRVLKMKTIELILKHAGQVTATTPGELPEQVYTVLRPEWEQMVRRSAWFILGKSDLLPVPATVKNVERRLGFSAEWVKDCLLDKRPELLGSRRLHSER